uniref:Uncharacterized protein n=1 Tax=Steinernema glaseri TaxID=37863 RepID=A0A1I7YCP3_9BILA
MDLLQRLLKKNAERQKKLQSARHITEEMRKLTELKAHKEERGEGRSGHPKGGRRIPPPIVKQTIQQTFKELRVAALREEAEEKEPRRSRPSICRK